MRISLRTKNNVLTNMTKKQNYIQAVGRRKSAVVRVRLFKGKGESKVNLQSADAYFPGPVLKDIWARPFKLANVLDKYYVTIKARGGGKKAQLDAAVHAIAKALVKESPENKKPLKAAGFLTRDARIRQRRMVGMGGKARRKKQSPKR